MAGLFRSSQQLMLLAPKRLMSGAVTIDPIRAKIGAREIVGAGVNGLPSYVDKPDYPMPAIRWRVETPDIKDLRVKEKGDWKKLTVAEKKALYRASFCQTIAEIQAPTGEWKSVTGWTLVFVSSAVWLYMLFKVIAYDPYPESFSEENQKAQLRRMIDLQMNPIEGISTLYPKPE